MGIYSLLTIFIINRHTNIFRCLAATNPSPPLLPGPLQTRTFGWLGPLGYALVRATATLNPANSMSWSTLNEYSLNNSWSIFCASSWVKYFMVTLVVQKCLKYWGKRPQSGAMRKIMNPARPLKMPTRRKNLQPMPAIFRSDQRQFKIANCHATQTFFLTQHIKMILFINFLRVLGDEKGSLPHRRNKTLLTDVKLRLQRRLRKGIPLTNRGDWGGEPRAPLDPGMDSLEEKFIFHSPNYALLLTMKKKKHAKTKRLTFIRSFTVVITSKDNKRRPWSVFVVKVLLIKAMNTVWMSFIAARFKQIYN